MSRLPKESPFPASSLPCECRLYPPNEESQILAAIADNFNIVNPPPEKSPITPDKLTIINLTHPSLDLSINLVVTSKLTHNLMAGINPETLRLTIIHPPSLCVVDFEPDQDDPDKFAVRITKGPHRDPTGFHSFCPIPSISPENQVVGMTEVEKTLPPISKLTLFIGCQAESKNSSQAAHHALAFLNP